MGGDGGQGDGVMERRRVLVSSVRTQGVNVYFLVNQRFFYHSEF